MMVEKIKNNIKREKGITLVALVVTIVVLLILAFISISLLTGENGIINKAEESKEETIKAKEREMIQLTYQDLEMEYTLKGTDITAERVWEKLKEYDNNIKVEMKAKEELGETEIVVEKNSGEEYAEITYEETGHKYAGSLLIDENKARYEVTYNANKGYGGPTKQIKIEGIPLTITGEIPERKGYSFKGWARESTAIIAEYVSGSQYTEDANVTLYAVWQLREDVEPVAQIGDTKYPSIQEAIYDCSEEAGETETTIILLKNTEEEFRTYEGQNIILDLQGYTVTSESTGVLCTNKGKMQIENGELRSNNGISIVNYGEITIGNNSNGIDDNTPTIYGKNVGIENNGVFNFYDGKIQGIIPIQGETTSTPEEYGPVQTGYENGITTVQLRILTQYEARIGWVYYETLQGAVDIAKAKETVSLIKDLQLKETLEVSQDKDVILDLYGYSLTVAPKKGTVINNYGNLEVTDKSQGQTGNITINTASSNTGIRNIGEKTLKITKVNIKSNANYASYGIYNTNSGKIEILGGKIESISVSGDSYGIYNSSDGAIKIIEGEIESTSNHSSSDSYGIYNKNTGNIIIEGGIINSTGVEITAFNVSSYGIYNANEGIIKMNGGEINSKARASYGIYNANNGNVEIAGGIINSKKYGIYNCKSGNIEVTGGEINGIGVRAYGIYNENTGTVKVKGGMINAISIDNERYSSGLETYGIYNIGSIIVEDGIINSIINNYTNDSKSYGIGNNGTLEIIGGIINSSIDNNSDSAECYGIKMYGGMVKILGGTINSNNKNKNNSLSYGIYSDSYDNNNKNTIIIGDKEKEISSEVPKIKVEGVKANCGIYNEMGDIQFFNGIIQSDIPLIGRITEVREGYQIEKNVIDELNSIYLVKKVENEYIVQIDNVKYVSLQKAIDSINEENKTIEVLKNFEINEMIEFNKNMTLDLKGYTITNNYYIIKNTSNLKIIDSSESKQGKIDNINTVIGILNNEKANLIVESGTINIGSNGYNTYTYGIYNLNNGNIEVTGGTINSSDDSTYESYSRSYGIYNESGIVKVNKGLVNSSCKSSNGASYGIYNGSGTIEVIEGTVSSRNNCTYKIHSDNYGIYNDSGVVKIKGGVINSTKNYSGSGGSSSQCYGMYNISGTVEITGGTINSNSSFYASYGIYNYGIGTILIKKGMVNSSSVDDSYGIYNNSSGTIELTGGEVISNGSKDDDSYGIYNYDTGNVIVGIKGDGLVSDVEPYIKGEYTGTSTVYKGYGIYNVKGKLYFYDGKIEGTTKAVYETITEREENTELNYNEDETILTLSTVLIDIAQIGERTYPTLQDAIEAVKNERETIKILRNVTYTNQDLDILIPKTKSIILDLNGYKINSALLEKVIQNEGILEIIDTSENKTGVIITSEETTIKNLEGAKLILSGGTIENRTKQSIYNGGEVVIQGGVVSNNNNYGIYNVDNGTVIINGGTINSKYGIYNENSGTIEVTKGIVNSQYGIYNKSSGMVKITGGTVKGDSYGIYNKNNGTIEVEEGIINSEDYGIYNKSDGMVKVTGGTVSCTIGYGSIYGIYNNSNGSIIIGTKGDEIVSQEIPYIQGGYTGTSTLYKGCGIYNSEGNLYFYDGKIQGTQDAISGNITEIEDSTEIIISQETIDNKSYKTITLNQVTTNVARVNGYEYNSITKAIQACGKIKSTIEILRDSNLGTTTIIEENQNITIDLKGYTINDYIELQNNGTLKIIDTSSEQSGKIVGLSGISVSNSGTMELESGGIADSGYGIKNTGTLNIIGGNIANNTYGIYNDGNGTVTIAGGNINTNTYGIYNYSGTLNIETSGITSNTYGIYVAGGITNIKEGAEVQSNIGIYSASGKLNIGEQGTMNPDSPVIIGETYGLSVSSTGTVYMYDGQVKGKEGAVEGYITYTEEGYVVANREEGEYKVNYLALGGTANAVAQVNGISYSNLQSAINSITGGEEQTITLLNGIIAGEIYEISEGQNIILDMNGKTITTDLEIAIKNSGNLTIVDTSNKNVASITSTTGVGIENSGTLTLGEDDGIENPDLIIIEGATHGITNTGTLNVYDGTIRPE